MGGGEGWEAVGKTMLIKVKSDVQGCHNCSVPLLSLSAHVLIEDN